MIVSTAISTAISANMAIDVHGRTIPPLCAKRGSRHVAARPRPLKIEPPNAAVHVEDLADERQPRTDARLHRRWVDLVERHAAGRDLGVGVAAIAFDRKRPLDERMRQAPPILAR